MHECDKEEKMHKSLKNHYVKESNQTRKKNAVMCAVTWTEWDREIYTAS